MGLRKIGQQLCNGCGVCVEDCPTDVIRLAEGTGKAYIAYAEDCCECLLCEKECPVPGAIELSLEPGRKRWFAW